MFEAFCFDGTMNLDSQNFSLSQINFLIKHLNKKNFKQSSQELIQVSNVHVFAVLCFVMSPYCESGNQSIGHDHFLAMFVI